MNNAFRSYFTHIGSIYRIFLLYYVTSIDVQKLTVVRRTFAIHRRTADVS